ncbi:F-box protein [Morus notabilis]|uniref:F-box protein n=1 Tax=Morus notabilis TaxID=981085 RepID=W9QMB5_9ROSA|nr:F-box protein CPR1 [Morus notabilis]EXB41585.1 F-box protein [Morus notabilis]
MATFLPWEIIVDILCRLPVKDLLRYRSVSKSWCSLIDGHDFIKLHLNHSLKTNSDVGVVFGGRNDLCWLDLDDLNSAERLPHPIDIGTGIDVVGGCNGLLALMNSNGDMAVWNPSTRRYISLPISDHFASFPFHVFQVLITGFGHDPITDDHKVLLMINFSGIIVDSFHCEAKVYSLKAKTWKRLDHFPNHIVYHRENGVLFANALHWLVNLKSQPSSSIFVFDLVTEDYREVALPDYKGAKTCWVKLVNIGGSFCVAVLPNQDSEIKNSDRVEVLVMKEYGVKESWTKLFSVVSSKVTGPFSYMIPVAYLKGGDQVLLDQDGEKLRLFDMKRRRVKNTTVGSGFPIICDTLVSVRSLVGVDGDADGGSAWKKAGKNNNVKEKKQSVKKR